MSFPYTRLRKRASMLVPPTTISSLPDDLVLSCLARVPRSYYPTLSLVSKKFRQLLASPELYDRSLLGRAETCLYVCLRLHGSDPDPRWFILCQKPTANKKKKEKKKKKPEAFGYVLATIPIPHSPLAYPGVSVAIDSNIYAFGASAHKAPPSSSVSILDCRSHTWHEAPSMRAERNFGNANVYDGKIYVAGGCQDKKYSSNWMEVYDPKTQTWETVLCPDADQRIRQINKSAVIDGRIIMFGDFKGLAYTPKEDRWASLDRIKMNGMALGWEWFSYCVVDDVLYCYRKLQYRGINWYDSKEGLWLNVIGLKGLPKIPKYSLVKLVCYGRKMAVLWDKNVPSSSGGGYKIWCAVVALEKRNNNREISGSVESLDDDVLTLPKSYKFECALTATI